MRALWSSSLSFGLINIPVRLYSGSTTRGGLDLHLLHKKDLSPVRFARVCRKDGKEIPFDEIVKGYEYQDGDYVVLTDEELEKANPEKSNTIDIKLFALESEIDSRYYDKPYILEPSKGADKPYALLREALAQSNKVAVCSFVLRTREHLGAIKTIGDSLVLNQMRFADDVVDVSQLRFPPASAASDEEIEIALKLIDQLTEKFEPDRFHDTYLEDIEELIEEKVRGKALPKKGPAKPTKTANKDLLSVLRASLEEGKRSKAS